MQIEHTDSGGAVVVLTASELAVTEVAMMHHLSGSGADCATTVHMMRDLAFANVEAELRDEERAADAEYGAASNPPPPTRG